MDDDFNSGFDTFTDTSYGGLDNFSSNNDYDMALVGQEPYATMYGLNPTTALHTDDSDFLRDEDYGVFPTAMRPYKGKTQNYQSMLIGENAPPVKTGYTLEEKLIIFFGTAFGLTLTALFGMVYLAF